jgi:dTDP-4-amino-4,6-dideoxygalactose transaminase
MIRFNIPYLVGNELDYVRDVLIRGRIAGDGEYTKRCSQMLRDYLCFNGSILLTHSCTAALEMTAILADIQPGDEIIMPSYTFSSTANAFVLRGGVPVFVDIRPDTLNIDERLIEAAITPLTKAIVPVHYAGVACEMDEICDIARRHNLLVIEDAAQALGSSYKGRKLGTLGDMATFSFHETKNVVSGEGGALVINNPKFLDRAEIIWEKGTNRSRFFRGEIDKYTWVDMGSSYLPSELVAAFLLAQLENIEKINDLRMVVWKQYAATLGYLQERGHICLAALNVDREHNAHLFYVLTKSHDAQGDLLGQLKAQGIGAVFHYVPLHSSDAGRRFGKLGSTMEITDDIAGRLIRLPVYPGLTVDDVGSICESITRVFP